MKSPLLGEVLKFLDTSVPLEAMLLNSGYSAQCIEIMGAIENGKETVITSPLTIAEIHHLLIKREKVLPESVKNSLDSLIDCIGLQVVDVDAGCTKDAITLSTKYNIDFVDSFNIILMRKYEISEIYSLDSHYDRFKDIKRLTLIGGK